MSVMSLTNEQIQAILDDAPDGAYYFDGDDYSNASGLVWNSRNHVWYDCGHYCCGTMLDSYREILTLRQRVQELENTLVELGYCNKCSMIPDHHFDEPFSTCACGTSEDYATRPLQIMQTLEKHIEELTGNV